MLTGPFVWEFNVKYQDPFLAVINGDLAHQDVDVLVDTEDAKPDWFTASSRHLERVSEPQEAWDRMTALVRLCRSAYAIRGKAFEFSLADVHKTGSPSVENVNANDSGLLFPFDERLCRAQRNGFILRQASGEASACWLFVSRYDPIVLSVLNFVGMAGLNWVTLYALMEFCTHCGWSKVRLQQKGAIDGDSSWLNRFTHTANSFEAIGPLSRHGPKGQQPPKNEMSQPEAQKRILACIRVLLKEWVDAFAESL
ncbi:hypothetical protein [Henriciella sp.]|uniref:hypothetical protein n=1 Tax=Henriciella sp. TaxID=1968823 RepID=UPI0026364911|nr:hypothetical protein [Henriciella sp.]